MSNDDSPIDDYPPNVVQLAKSRWNADQTHFINWDTLVFQAIRNEGTSKLDYNQAVAEANRIIVEAKVRKTEEAAKPKPTLEVWKFEYDLTREKDVQEFEVPRGAKFLSVKGHISFNDRLSIYIWALVNPTAEKTTRQIHAIGTGHDVPSDAEYIGTAFFGSIVLHVWETFTP